MEVEAGGGFPTRSLFIIRFLLIDYSLRIRFERDNLEVVGSWALILVSDIFLANFLATDLKLNRRFRGLFILQKRHFFVLLIHFLHFVSFLFFLLFINGHKATKFSHISAVADRWALIDYIRATCHLTGLTSLLHLISNLVTDKEIFAMHHLDT